MNSLSVGTALSREEEIFQQGLVADRTRASRMFAVLMLAQWASAVGAALLISPNTWIGAQPYVHRHVWFSLMLGLLLTSLPVVLAAQRPAAAVTRHVVAAAQMGFSALLIHLTGGRIETHFHVFVSLAFLAFFRDRRVLVTASAVVALDHLVRGVYFPLSVFGTTDAGAWRWLEHAGWVLFEDVVLFIACAQTMREGRRMAHDRAEVERTRDAVEAQVVVRTSELLATAEALRRSEEETRAAMESAEAASRAKSDFLANMSHEIRTPMSAILGYAELLADPLQSPEERALAGQRIRSNGQHLLGIINDILDLSKVEAGKMEVEAIACAPRQICEEVFSLTQARAADKRLRLRFEVPNDLPPIVSDPLRLRQVLTNLLSNAVKFTDEGEVRFRVECVPGDPSLANDAITLRFIIADSGIGMSAAQLASLFRPFAQADSSMSRRFGGTGLGLYISNRLVHMLGGTINVRSEPGKGSEFVVTITARRASDTDVSTSDAPHAAAPGALNPPGRLNARILLAEDGPDNQRLISLHLRRAGAQVVVAPDGAAAVAAALASRHEPAPFDLVLMDMQMPELDGYGATALLRERGWETPIIALTAHAMLGDRERCLRAGCNDYLTKPIDRHRLVAACSRWLEQSAAGRAA